MTSQDIALETQTPSQWVALVMNGLSESQKTSLKLSLDTSPQSFRQLFAQTLAHAAGKLLVKMMGDRKDLGHYTHDPDDAQSVVDRQVMRHVMARIIPAMRLLDEESFTRCLHGLRVSFANNAPRLQRKNPHPSFGHDLSPHVKLLLADQLALPGGKNRQLEIAVTVLSDGNPSAIHIEALENWRAQESKDGIEEAIQKSLASSPASTPGLLSRKI